MLLQFPEFVSLPLRFRRGYVNSEIATKTSSLCWSEIWGFFGWVILAQGLSVISLSVVT